MYGLLLFLRNVYVVALFIIIEGVALYFYANSPGRAQSQLLSYASYVTAGVNSATSGVYNFFLMPRVNRELVNRVAELERELNIARLSIPDSLHRDSVVRQRIIREEYRYIPARVISNSINKANNFITINAGRVDGVKEDMALVTPSGEMVGYISSCSEHYAVATSVLSRTFRSSGKLSDDNYFGSLWWSGDNRYKLKLSELSKYASLQHGDTIVTTGFSQIFPSGITIGRVVDYSLDELGTSFEVDIELAADLSALDRVVVVGREEELFIHEE